MNDTEKERWGQICVVTFSIQKNTIMEVRKMKLQRERGKRKRERESARARSKEREGLDEKLNDR